jgi:hypothetical protein
MIQRTNHQGKKMPRGGWMRSNLIGGFVALHSAVFWVSLSKNISDSNFLANRIYGRRAAGDTTERE